MGMIRVIELARISRVAGSSPRGQLVGQLHGHQRRADLVGVLGAEDDRDRLCGLDRLIDVGVRDVARVPETTQELAVALAGCRGEICAIRDGNNDVWIAPGRWAEMLDGHAVGCRRQPLEVGNKLPPLRDMSLSAGSVAQSVFRRRNRSCLPNWSSPTLTGCHRR